MRKLAGFAIVLLCLVCAGIRISFCDLSLESSHPPTKESKQTLAQTFAHYIRGLLYDGENKIEQAIEETRGMVLSNDNRVCNIYFTYSCGGHTENSCDVWNSDTPSFSHAKIDGNSGLRESFDLTREDQARKWILSRPDVYCNLVADAHVHSLKNGHSKP